MRTLANIPNLLTFARLLLAPFVFTAIVSGHGQRALALFACAALTDGLDGLLARRFHQITPLGAYLDPIADKFLLSGVYFFLAVIGSVPWWLVAIIFGRDIFLLLTSGIALMFTAFRQFRPVSGVRPALSCRLPAPWPGWRKTRSRLPPCTRSPKRLYGPRPRPPSGAASITVGVDYVSCGRIDGAGGPE